MRFVIIGGDAAGMSAASRARRNQKDLEIVVLEQSLDVSYSACGMPYNLADPNRDMDDLVVRKASVFRDKQGIDLRLGHRVETIDRSAKVVSGLTSDGRPFEVGYDKLLIATGASPVIPDIPGTELPGVMALKSLADGRRIKHYMSDKKVQNAVIIGMGYIGMEMAEAFFERGVRVDMVKPRPKVLPWMPDSVIWCAPMRANRFMPLKKPGRVLKWFAPTGVLQPTWCSLQQESFPTASPLSRQAWTWAPRTRLPWTGRS